jgi:dsRNA-specific ribonuclease
MFDNIPLVNASLTASSTQMQANNERLESYGDSLIAFLVILELFLTRHASDYENELDSLRKSRTQNELLMLQNLTSGVWEHMLVEPQTQQAFRNNNNSLLQESSIGSQNIIKVMTPGGLGDNKFKNKLKTIKDLTI